MKQVTLLLAMIVISSSVFGKTFYLKDGTSVAGKIVQKSDTTVIIEDERGNTQSIPVSMLKEEPQVTGNSSSETKSPEPSIDYSSIKDFSIYLNLGSMSVLGGDLNSIFASGVSLNDLVCGIGFDWYFLKIFGLSLGCDFVNAISASATNSSSLSVGGGQTFKSLLLLRIPFHQNETSTWFFKIFAGPNYSMFDFSNDFKNALQSAASKSGYSVSFFTGQATGFGFSGGLGALYQYQNFGFGVDLILQNKNVKYAEATKSFGWTELGILGRISVDF